ncbi:ricin-type beta-trefoil lectin domain protein [Xanthomonas nasturtii]|uniref:ricin-type beta-trefoil lectin domain protein n=1 Tax=Xanthomonas nasturtii TaxID=1843581 RepID=UPI002B22F22B|nr:ricin-type beta-trefoil lectin domain protein [Xanthomonas nasturtii]MEA9578472.1 ricin-type beta-trefoil lectin domain protein [Xanthomonas nasturtii]
MQGIQGIVMVKKSALVAALVAAVGGGFLFWNSHSESSVSGVGQAVAQSQVAAKMSASGGIQAASGSRQAKSSHFFDAPDNGTLLSYESKQATASDGPFAVYPARLSESYALRAVLEGTMKIMAPDGTELKMEYVRHTQGKNGNWTWVGRLPGALVGEESVITFGKDAVFGSLGSKDGNVYQISTVNGSPFVMAAPVSAVQAATPSRKGDSRELLASSIAKLQPQSTGIVPGYTSLEQVNANAGTTATNSIDVLLGYTTGYKNYRGGESAVETILTNMVEQANQAFVNASINTRYRLVGTLEVNYTDAGVNDQVLNELTSITASNAAFVPLRQLRDNLGADLVALVRRFSVAQDSCGVAWRNGTTDSRYGYAEVSDGIDGNFFCTPTTLGHELGHLLGSGHTRESTDTDYNYGHRSDVGSFHTLMAYSINGQREVNIYSSPVISDCFGQPCGVSMESDNKTAFIFTVPRIIQYRAPLVPFDDLSSPGQVSGPTGKCLDIAGGVTQNGANIQVWGCNGFAQQKWSLQRSGRSLMAAANKVLDIAGFSSENGATIQLWDSLNAANQAWYFSNSSIIVSGGKVLDVAGASSSNGARLQLYDNLRGGNQIWKYTPSTGQIQVSTGRCLDVAGFDNTPGAPVQLWDCSNSKNQVWTLGKNGSIRGYGGNCLTAIGSLNSNGTSVIMAQCNGGAGQSWRIRGEIRTESNHKCLDDSAGGLRNGARVQLWQCLGNSNQTWEVQPN